MKLLIVASDESLRSAVEAQCQQRHCAVERITAAQLIADNASDDEHARESGVWILDVAAEYADAEFQQWVDVCAQRQQPLLLVSDSRVFAVGGKQRYRESDAPRPSSAIGEQLLRRERYLAEHLPCHVILRTGSLLAATGDNLLTHFLQRFRAGGAIEVSNEPRFCPTPVTDVARVISAIYDQLNCAAQCWGIYHYHSSDAATGYEFAEVLLAAAAQYWDVGGEHVQLQAVSAEPFGGVFPTLNCQHIRDTFGIQQLPWRKAIPPLLKQIYASEST